MALAEKGKGGIVNITLKQVFRAKIQPNDRKVRKNAGAVYFVSTKGPYGVSESWSHIENRDPKIGVTVNPVYCGTIQC